MAYKHLTFQDRQRIAALYSAEASAREIAGQLGIHIATVYRELDRGHTGADDTNHRPGYDPVKAQRSAQRRNRARD